MRIKKNDRWSKIASSFIFANVLIFSSNAQTINITTNEAKNQYSTNLQNKHTSVHDPSVVYDNVTNQYYIFGSHRAISKTTDMQNWEWIDSKWTDSSNNNLIDYKEAFKTNNIKEITKNNIKIPFGNFNASEWNCVLDGEEWLNGNMWAPDIIYNPTMKKWCQYLSLNGSKWNSCIVLLTSDNIEGPYIYEGPIIYTGFINDTDPRISYKKTDLEIVLGSQTELPKRYNQGEGWWNIWPHAIDPCVFYDEQGKLWLTYGSWFGGIYILELDENTGLRDYDINYESNYDSRKAAVTSDAYFGKKIAGGFGVSGEGPYINHIGEYYYLFITNGEFAPDGGYEMRIFRSKNPDGPYVDTNNKSAIYNSWALNYGNGDTRGEKLLGAYNNWGFMNIGECSQGHNSVIIGEDNNTYLVYHTKFNDGTFGHLVRVHQMFMNNEGWPVVAPFEYSGENINDKDISSTSIFDKEDIIGTYNIIVHKYGMNHREFEEAKLEMISLNADGTISGAYKGTWAITNQTSYISINLGSDKYNGVVVEQRMEPTDIKALCFTGCNQKGVNVWGYKMTDKNAIAYSINNLKLPFNNLATINSNIDLYNIKVENNVNIEWTSNSPEVISNTGKYNPAGLTSKEQVTLSLKLSCGDYYWTKDYKVYANTETTYPGDYLTGFKAFYDFNNQPILNSYNKSHEAILKKQGTNILPTIEQDNSRIGNILHQYFGANSNCSYTQLINPLKNEVLDGATISMWVKRTDNNLWDALWSFYDSSKSCRLYMTGNSYIGFNNSKGSWIDINHPNNVTTNNIPVNEWTLVTLTISRNNGCNFYINGNKITNLIAAGQNSGSDINSISNFNYNLIIDFLQESPYFYLGYGSFWGSADVYFDDIMIYNRELSETDVTTLNKVNNKVTDFTGGNSNAIDITSKDNNNDIINIYNINGQKIDQTEKGFYIINNKKTIIK